MRDGRMRAKSVVSSLALLSHIVSVANGGVVQKVFGANSSEVAYASSGGGTHVYVGGVDVGSAFAPPDVFIGSNGDARCVVQPFTSSNNRLHCVISAEGLPPPDLLYNASGRFVDMPMQVVVSGRPAQCWHMGGINHRCKLRFDLGATPRFERILTPVLQSSGLLRVSGRGIDGGLIGPPGMVGTLYRGGQVVVGVCGEKDCGAQETDSFD